jgi:hypothetical protein
MNGPFVSIWHICERNGEKRKKRKRNLGSLEKKNAL